MTALDQVKETLFHLRLKIMAQRLEEVIQQAKEKNRDPLSLSSTSSQRLTDLFSENFTTINPRPSWSVTNSVIFPSAHRAPTSSSRSSAQGTRQSPR